MTWQTWTKWIGALALAATWVAAGASGGKVAAPGDAAQRAWLALQTEVGDAACDRGDQCHSLPIGSRGCGGPKSYLVWSSKVADRDKLLALASAYERAAAQLPAPLISNCAFLMDPGAVCVAARCAPGSVDIPR